MIITAVTNLHVTLAVSTASPLLLLTLRFCHCVPPRVYVVQSNFQANRLRRLPVAPSNPLTGFQNSHACSMHFHSRRSLLYTRILSKSRAVLSTASPLYDTLSDEPITQNSSLNSHSTSWDAGCPTFLQNSVSNLGHGCTSEYFFFCPAIQSFKCHLLWLRNQIVGRAFAKHPDALFHPQPLVVTLL